MPQKEQFRTSKFVNRPKKRLGRVEIRFSVSPGKVSALWVRKIIRGALLHEDRMERSLGVLLTDNRSIRNINKKFLNHDYATDVIAFGLNEGAVLGDIVVSVETARCVAKELKIPFKEELARYLVHGTLHLLGYEDKPKKQHDKMHKRQEQILDVILAKARISK